VLDGLVQRGGWRCISWYLFAVSKKVHTRFLKRHKKRYVRAHSRIDHASRALGTSYLFPVEHNTHVTRNGWAGLAGCCLVLLGAVWVLAVLAGLAGLAGLGWLGWLGWLGCAGWAGGARLAGVAGVAGLLAGLGCSAGPVGLARLAAGPIGRGS